MIWRLEKTPTRSDFPDWITWSRHPSNVLLLIDQIFILDNESESSIPSSTSIKVYDNMSLITLSDPSSSMVELPTIFFNRVFFPISISPRKTHVASGALNLFELSFNRLLQRFCGSVFSAIARWKKADIVCSSKLSACYDQYFICHRWLLFWIWSTKVSKSASTLFRRTFECSTESIP